MMSVQMYGIREIQFNRHIGGKYELCEKELDQKRKIEQILTLPNILREDRIHQE